MLSAKLLKEYVYANKLERSVTQQGLKIVYISVYWLTFCFVHANYKSFYPIVAWSNLSESIFT